MLTLLWADFVRLRAELLLRRFAYPPAGSTSKPRFRWAYDRVRSKFRISFGRSFSEAALSSLWTSGLCCVLTASERSESDWRDLMPVQGYTRYTRKYMALFAVKDLPSWLLNPVLGVWLTCMSILLVHHWFERCPRPAFEAPQHPIAARCARPPRNAPDQEGRTGRLQLGVAPRGGAHSG